jgi:hypothetical protein
MPENNSAASDEYAFGDEEAAAEVGLPQKEIRKMRVAGLLGGAFTKTGWRTIIYHRGRLKRRVDEAFAKGGVQKPARTAVHAG